MSVFVPCGLCGAEDFELRFPGAIDDSKNAKLHFSSSRQSALHYDVVCCSRCGLLLENPRDDQPVLAEVYAGLRDDVYDGDARNRHAAAADYLRLVRGEHAPPARLLDLGCGTGYFAASASAAGYEVQGADPSSWSIERARQRCARATFAVSSLEAFEPQSPLDVVTLWDVLEHVHSPRAALSHVHSWLEPGGLLLMSMPNAESLVARALASRWVLLLREHLWYFSPSTIARLLDECGFELVRVAPKWVSSTLAHVVHRLSQREGAHPFLARWSRATPLKQIALRFPIGEMNVVARKR